ncbi:MAG: cytochrome C oxidase subunit I [Burkholderiaceae bacterium]
MKSNDVPNDSPADAPEGVAATGRRRRNRLILLALLAVSVAPVVASYLLFYVFPPDGRTNYGQLVQPQRDLTSVPVTAEEIAAPEPEQTAITLAPGAQATFSAFTGRWLMVVPSLGCDTDCRERLVAVRQVRLTTGRERSRVDRVWLRLDQNAPPADVLAEHPGLHVLHIDTGTLTEHFPAAGGHSPTEHIYMVDPLGHLMMRWPVQADPNRMKKDVMRLLKASRIG